jgi:hypothetical protein
MAGIGLASTESVQYLAFGVVIFFTASVQTRWSQLAANSISFKNLPENGLR